MSRLFVLTTMMLLTSMHVRCAGLLRHTWGTNHLIRTASILHPRIALGKGKANLECAATPGPPSSSLLSRTAGVTTSHVSSSSKRWGIVPFAFNAPNPSNAPTPKRSAILDAFNSLWRCLTSAIKLLASLLLFISILPYVISSRWGTAAASRLTSRVFPGDINIHRIELGWWQPIGVEGLSVHEGRGSNSRQLISIPKLKSAETLYSVVWGSGITLTITKPQIDCSYDDLGEQLRLSAYFQAAKLINLLKPSSSSSSSSKESTSVIDQQQPTADHTSSSSSSSSREELPAAVSEPVQSHPILTDADSLHAAEAAATAEAAAAALALSPIRQRLTVADSVAQFSAEFMLPNLSVYIPDGQLLMPAEVRAAVGPHIHAAAAVGQQQVLNLAEELTEDATWLQQQQQQQQQKEEESGSSCEDDGDGNSATAAAAAAAASWDIPPKDITSRKWQEALPVLLQVTGDHLDAVVRGWRLPDGNYLLQQPAAANWEFTPELAKLTLSLYNPLFQEIGYVREGGHIMSYYSPEMGLLPAEHAEVHVSPLKFVMGQGQLLKQVYRLLDMAQGSGILRKSWSSSNLKAIEVWSGPMAVSVKSPGVYETNRLDMLIGSGSATLHLAVWGTVNTSLDTLDMTIGLPASTLAKIGIKNLPETYMLPLAVTGTLTKPQLQWAPAVRKLAVLSAMQLGDRVWQGGEGFRAAGSNNDKNNGNDNSGQGLGMDASSGFRDGRQQQQGLAGLLFPGWFGAANRALTTAASSFIGQVDQRLQQELIDVPAPADLPWQQQQRPATTSSSSSNSEVEQQQQGQQADEDNTGQQQQQ